MKFSSELVEQCKIKLGFKKDAELLEVIPKMTKGLLSSVKNGARPLTDEQALAIAELCKFNPEWVLVNLSAELAERKSNEALRSVWAGLAKKLAANGLALALVGLLSISSGYQVGKHVLLRRSRLFA